MRLMITALVFGSVVISACSGTTETVSFDFVNDGDLAICFNTSSKLPRDCREIGPHAAAVWRLDCEYSEKPITVLLTLGRAGREIYTRTATCSEWENASPTFVIEQEPEYVFTITDNMPDETAGP